MSDLLSGLLGGGRGGGLRMAAVALLLHQLMKRSGQGARREDAPGGGGLEGMLGGLLGGGAPAGQGGGLGGLLGGGNAPAGQGGGLGGLLSGLGGLLGGLRGQGLSPEVDSWVSSGPNRPVEGRRLAPAFDADELDSMARRAGTDRESLLQEIGRVLPDFVDRMTPQGRLPAREEEVGGGLGGLLSGLLGGGASRDGPSRGTG